jgi:hypothetical protein
MLQGGRLNQGVGQAARTPTTEPAGALGDRVIDGDSSGGATVWDKVTIMTIAA